MLNENFITLVAQDNGAEARLVLQDELSNRVLETLEARKRELASGLFGGTTAQVTEEKDKEKHNDEEKDEKLVKKLVKKDCLTKEETTPSK